MTLAIFILDLRDATPVCSCPPVADPSGTTWCGRLHPCTMTGRRPNLRRWQSARRGHPSRGTVTPRLSRPLDVLAIAAPCSGSQTDVRHTARTLTTRAQSLVPGPRVGVAVVVAVEVAVVWRVVWST